MQRPNIRFMGIPEGTAGEPWFKNEFNEITNENFLNMGKELQNRIQEEHRTPNRVDQK